MISDGQEIFLFPTTTRLALGPTHPSLEWESWVLSWGLSSWCMSLATHFYQVLRLSAVTPLHVVYASTVCTEMTLDILFLS